MEFPVFKKINGQFFKILSHHSAMYVRKDGVFTGYGLAENMPGETVSTMLNAYEDSNETEFNDALREVHGVVMPHLSGIDTETQGVFKVEDFTDGHDAPDGDQGTAPAPVKKSAKKSH
jgi:hypothetical protein